MKNVYINIEDNPGFLNSFLDYTATILNKSPNTIKEYNYDLNTFLKYILYHFKMTDEKDLKNISIRNMSIDTVSKITLDDIHSFLFYLTNTYNSKAATRARKVSSIRVFFNYLCNKTNQIEKNPAQNLETPKLDKRIPKYLTLDDSKKLLEAVNTLDDRNKERDYAIITLFLNCGMRLSELVGINIKDINFNDQKLNVIGKGNKERTIYLNTACMNAINSYLAIRPHDKVKYDSKDALFLSERRERISNRTVQYIVKQELRRAGLDTNKYSVHKLRHTAATLMYKYGNVDITAPRTAIGQRKDGIVLMLVIDGRRTTMPGATMEDLIEIMERYGAYNAAALDGGTSTAMVENGTLVNDPIDSTGAHTTRPIATGFGAVFTKKDDE